MSDSDFNPYIPEHRKQVNDYRPPGPPRPVVDDCGHDLGTMTGPFYPQVRCDECSAWVWPRLVTQEAT